jgi:hypothetical protein
MVRVLAMRFPTPWDRFLLETWQASFSGIPLVSVL